MTTDIFELGMELECMERRSTQKEVEMLNGRKHKKGVMHVALITSQ